MYSVGIQLNAMPLKVPANSIVRAELRARIYGNLQEVPVDWDNRDY